MRHLGCANLTNKNQSGSDRGIVGRAVKRIAQPLLRRQRVKPVRRRVNSAAERAVATALGSMSRTSMRNRGRASGARQWALIFEHERAPRA
jgi:hypothetical protein